MLTIFTTCKPCNYPTFELMQRNAIQSWKQIVPCPEILVMGRDQGTKEICEDLGVIHIPEVKTTEYGTPYLDDMFRIAKKRASFDHLALVSSDVVLFQSVIDALNSLKEMKEFCAVCRKKTQYQIDPIDFSSNWQEKVLNKAQWNLITSGDFYIFNKDYWEEIPPFVIGRCMCDSWLFYAAEEKGTLVDLTDAIEIVDYYHSHDHWLKDNRSGEKEKDVNVTLVKNKIKHICHANWSMNRNYTVVKKPKLL